MACSVAAFTIYKLLVGPYDSYLGLKYLGLLYSHWPTSTQRFSKMEEEIYGAQEGRSLTTTGV